MLLRESFRIIRVMTSLSPRDRLFPTSLQVFDGGTRLSAEARAHTTFRRILRLHNGLIRQKRRSKTSQKLEDAILAGIAYSRCMR
jgi:hypothetical protein